MSQYSVQRIFRVTSWALVVLAVGACAGGGGERETISVYAASSLTELFEALESSFEASHPSTDVALNFAGSQVLRLQIEQGAPADVFASADLRHMDALVTSGRIAAPRVFAHNELVLIVPLDNPAGLESFSDLPRATRLVVGSQAGPVGSYTRAVLAAAGTQLGEEFEATVTGNIVSEESNVRGVRAKVELGEADALARKDGCHLQTLQQDRRPGCPREVRPGSLQFQGEFRAVTG